MITSCSVSYSAKQRWGGTIKKRSKGERRIKKKGKQPTEDRQTDIERTKSSFATKNAAFVIMYIILPNQSKKCEKI